LLVAGVVVAALLLLCLTGLLLYTITAT